MTHIVHGVGIDLILDSDDDGAVLSILGDGMASQRVRIRWDCLEELSAHLQELVAAMKKYESLKDIAA